MSQGLAPLHGGDPDVLAVGVLADLPEYDVYDGLLEAVALGGQVLEGFNVELGPALLYAVPAQGSAQGPALEGCPEEARVADGGLSEGGVLRVRGGWLVGLLGSCASTLTYGWPWVGLAGLGGARWPPW